MQDSAAVGGLLASENKTVRTHPGLISKNPIVDLTTEKNHFIFSAATNANDVTAAQYKIKGTETNKRKEGRKKNGHAIITKRNDRRQQKRQKKKKDTIYTTKRN